MPNEIVTMSDVRLEERPERYAGPEAFPYECAMESADMLSQALHERYLCPENFLEFVLSAQLSSDMGFFHFGPTATCYGRSCGGTRKAGAEAVLYDALEDVAISDAKLRLPFDPTEIIDNLRLERYVDSLGTKGSFPDVFRKLYYLVRPFTNRRVRKQVQKFRTRNWEHLTFPKWPVDTTVENICESLLLLSMEAKGVDRVPFVWFWPSGARGCLMMTHDVETRAGRDSCAELMDIDDSYGIKASFQLVPHGRYGVSQEFLAGIRMRGFDIGIQDYNHDGRLFDDREEFLRRAAVINRYAGEYGAKGFRAAVLYRKPEWYDVFDFSFDMSIPNVAHLDPQRGGCCTVMPYFIGDILELPVTTTQDYMQFHILDQRSIDLWKTQIELILEKNGLASFIVHPDYVTEPDTKVVYKTLLHYLSNLCSETGIWSALPVEVDSWWRARSRMRLQRIGNSWRIMGEGAERAVLAHAKNVGGKLVYELSNTNGTDLPPAV